MLQTGRKRNLPCYCDVTQWWRH